MIECCHEDLHDHFAANTPWSTKELTAEQLALFYRLMFFIPGNIYPTIAAIDVRCLRPAYMRFEIELTACFS